MILPNILRYTKMDICGKNFWQFSHELVAISDVQTTTFNIVYENKITKKKFMMITITWGTYNNDNPEK